MRRLNYIDIAKGVLIIFVFLHHTNYRIERGGVFWDYGYILDWLNYLYKMMFMPAFFMITGMVSSFDKPAKEFLIKNVKSLLFPTFILGFIIWYLETIFSKHSFRPPIGIIKSGGAFWFLTSLFVVKIIYYILRKNVTSNKLYLFLILFVFYMLSPIIPKHLIGDLGLLRSTLGLAVFLHIGVIIKNHLSWKYGIGGGFIYLCFMVFYIITEKDIPFITNGLNITIVTAIPYLIVAISGTICLLFLCQLIHTCTFLEYIGQNSLVIYCLHGSNLSMVIYLVGLCIHVSTIACIFCIVISFIITCFSPKLFQIRPFNYLIGVF